jgi:uncharacterized protein (TIGR02186 family)
MRGLLLPVLLLLAYGLPAAAQDAAAPRSVPRPTFAPTPPVPQEKVEADISTRTLEVTTGFTGHEIIVFGSVDNSQAPREQYAGYYDVVVVVEGTPFPIVVRRKSDVAGVWVNTSSVTFGSVPSYYAIASTRPIEQVAGPGVLERHAIGLQHIKMTPSGAARSGFKDYEVAAFRSAVIRLKKKDNLYVLAPNGVEFVGRSLFRSTIALPANVPVGPLVARTYLFRNGEVISAHIARVTLHRTGIEWLVHNFAFVYPMSYGLIAVLIAVGCGLLASAYFRRQTA